MRKRRTLKRVSQRSYGLISSAVVMIASNSHSELPGFGVCSPPPFVDVPEVMMGGLGARSELSVEF
jgi:hypothetical protein